MVVSKKMNIEESNRRHYADHSDIHENRSTTYTANGPDEQSLRVTAQTRSGISSVPYGNGSSVTRQPYHTADDSRVSDSGDKMFSSISKRFKATVSKRSSLEDKEAESFKRPLKETRTTTAHEERKSTEQTEKFSLQRGIANPNPYINSFYDSTGSSSDYNCLVADLSSLEPNPTTEMRSAGMTNVSRQNREMPSVPRSDFSSKSFNDENSRSHYSALKSEPPSKQDVKIREKEAFNKVLGDRSKIF